MEPDTERFILEKLVPSEEGGRELYEIRFAAAALLLACAKSDSEEDQDEEDAIISILKERFSVEDDMLDDLISFADAHTETDQLDAFTGLVNKHYSDAHKQLLIEDLWKVAYADGRIDKFEDFFIARVAGQIGVTPESVGAMKDAANPD